MTLITFQDDGVDRRIKLLMLSFTALVFIIGIASGSNFFLLIISFGAGWFVFAGTMIKWAHENDRDPNGAFYLGVMFSLIGMFFYWVFLKVRGRGTYNPYDADPYRFVFFATLTFLPVIALFAIGFVMGMSESQLAML